jgi:hypothetical protein
MPWRVPATITAEIAAYATPDPNAGVRTIAQVAPQVATSASGRELRTCGDPVGTKHSKYMLLKPQELLDPPLPPRVSQLLTATKKKHGIIRPSAARV